MRMNETEGNRRRRRIANWWVHCFIIRKITRFLIKITARHGPRIVFTFHLVLSLVHSWMSCLVELRSFNALNWIRPLQCLDWLLMLDAIPHTYEEINSSTSSQNSGRPHRMPTSFFTYKTGNARHEQQQMSWKNNNLYADQKAVESDERRERQSKSERGIEKEKEKTIVFHCYMHIKFNILSIYLYKMEKCKKLNW